MGGNASRQWTACSLCGEIAEHGKGKIHDAPQCPHHAAAGGGDKSKIIFDKDQRVYYHTGTMKVVAGGRGRSHQGAW